MIREVLTEYGPISRLWWDHYMAGCGGLSECPDCTDPTDPKCFPNAWTAFTQLVRNVSSTTLLGTGEPWFCLSCLPHSRPWLAVARTYLTARDCSGLSGPDVGHSGGGETGVGDYPVWNAVNDTQHPNYGPLGYIFK